MHPIPQIVSRRRRASGTIVALTGLTLLSLCAEGGAAPTRSTNIALTGDRDRLVNVNHEADSVTLFDVRRGGRRLKKSRRGTGGPGAPLRGRGPARR